MRQVDYALLYSNELSITGLKVSAEEVGERI